MLVYPKTRHEGFETDIVAEMVFSAIFNAMSKKSLLSLKEKLDAHDESVGGSEEAAAFVSLIDGIILYDGTKGEI